MFIVAHEPLLDIVLYPERGVGSYDPIHTFHA